MAEADRRERLTFWQRSVLRRLRKAGHKGADEPLTPEDWATYFKLMSGRTGRLWTSVLRSLPASPRCGICGAPFSGFGSRLVRPLGVTLPQRWVRATGLRARTQPSARPASSPRHRAG